MSDLFPDPPAVEVGEVKDIYCRKDRSRTDIDYSHCEGCPLQGNPKVWSWRGDYDASICFIGMNPGAREKFHKLPFVGPSGRKLETRVIRELSLNDGRKETVADGETLALSGCFYLTNVVKCWTANNDTPPSDAVNRCWNYLEPELEGREVIIPLGRLCQKAVRNRYNGPAIIHDMIHPSAALRKGKFDARLIKQTKELSEIIEE
mgnify:CR=1 FL=1